LVKFQLDEKNAVENYRSLGRKKVELRETQRAVSPFDGLVVFFESLRQVGYREAVSKHLPFRFTSPNAIDPVETFSAFLLSVRAGARRFAHTSLLRADLALQALLGISRFPGDVGDTPLVRLSERAHRIRQYDGGSTISC